MSLQIVDLPSPQALARIASSATQMLFSTPIEFSGSGDATAPVASFGHTTVIPLIGAPAYIISARASDDGGYGLAGVMFDCATEAVDDAMVTDALGELVNIMAGEIKALVAPTHTLGLPTRLTDENTLMGAVQSVGARVFVRTARAEIELAILVFEAKTLEMTPDHMASAKAPRPRRVLIVDDDATVRAALRSVVETAGCFVVGEAENGQQALAIIAIERPEVVFLDIEMPGIKGTDVLAEIRRRVSDTVVLLISGYITAQNVMRGVGLAVDGVIAKPFKRQTVVEELDRALLMRAAGRR